MSETNVPLLVVQHLTLAFGSVTAIDDLSFTARDNQITAILGPGGAGKTSVLNCISGLCRPGSGGIEFHTAGGAPLLLERMESWRITREARIARTFRNPRIFAGLTVLENVLLAQNAMRSRAAELAALFTSAKSRKAAQRARYWLDRMGLSQVAESPAGVLSPGSQRRLEIARALAADPRLLCLDEPAAGLDRWEQDALIRRMQDSKQQMPAVLITGHEAGTMESLCDHAVVLDRGRAIASGKARDLCSDAAVLCAWLGVPPGGESVPRIAASC